MRLNSQKRYPIFKDESHCSEEAYKREESILLYEKLRDEGCSEKTALEAIKTKRSTFYRWKKAYKNNGVAGLEAKSRKPHTPRTRMWSIHDENLVISLRKKHKIWGKEKIATLMQRDHESSLSISSVGRIISKLVDLGRLRPAYVCKGRDKPKKRRVFTSHAQRWKYGSRSTQPGELMQMDHTIITTDSGKDLRSFSAICPFTKMIFEHVYSRATSACAADFLKRALAYFPFPITSIQVDGGSEFMADFEKTCENNNIPLYVLPPRRPQYNGAVERSHLTLYDEFFARLSHIENLAILRERLSRYLTFYNTFRPHHSIGNKTPWDFWVDFSSP